MLMTKIPSNAANVECVYTSIYSAFFIVLPYLSKANVCVIVLKAAVYNTVFVEITSNLFMGSIIQSGQGSEHAVPH
jgi:hypothetical protein